MNGPSAPTRELRFRSAKFVASRTRGILLDLSSSHPYQALVLISTAQCNAGLRRKRFVAGAGTVTVTPPIRSGKSKKTEEVPPWRVTDVPNNEFTARDAVSATF